MANVIQQTIIPFSTIVQKCRNFAKVQFPHRAVKFIISEVPGYALRAITGPGVNDVICIVEGDHTKIILHCSTRIVIPLSGVSYNLQVNMRRGKLSIERIQKSAKEQVNRKMGSYRRSSFA